MATAEPTQNAAPIACRGCTYDLTSLPAGVCPECGRNFDPNDPRSVLSARQLRFRRYRLLRPVLIALAATAVILSGMWVGVIPRPILGPQGGLGYWVWMGHGYGVQRVDRWAESLRVHRWGSRVTKIESFDVWSSSAPRPLWSLERLGADRWRMRVRDPYVTWQSLLLGFNTMRPDAEIFGLSITESRRVESGQHFEVEGARQDVLAAMIRVYGLQTTPGLISPTDDDVWVVDPDSGDLVEVPVPRALEMGYEVTPFRDIGVERIEIHQ